MALDYGYYGRQSDAVSPGVAPSTQTPTGIPANGDKARFNRHQVTWTNRLSLGAVGRCHRHGHAGRAWRG